MTAMNYDSNLFAFFLGMQETEAGTANMFHRYFLQFMKHNLQIESI